VLGKRLLFVAAFACFAVLALVAFARRPEHAFLVSSDRAEWIRAEEPFDLVARPLALKSVPFRYRFENPDSRETGAPATLRVQALRAFRLSVNGRVVGESGPQEASWRYARSFDLSPYLVPGTNDLRIDVQNDQGPPLVMASSLALGIATSREWEAPGPDGTWQRTMTASDGRSNPISEQFPSAWQGLCRTWALWLVSFLVGAGASVARSRGLASSAGWVLRPSVLRWLLLGALVLIGIHNLKRVDIDAGFDAESHFEYIRTVAVSHRVPLANEGWQFFQPPLFYLLAAPPYLVIARIASEATAMIGMRVLVLLCGLGLVEMVYRAARAAFPAREDLQAIATATGGFLPVTIYMSHYVSNEPLAALLTAALVVSSFRLIGAAHPRLDRWGSALGVLFGLALLAKVTVAILLPLLVAVLFRAAQSQSLPLRSAAGPLVRFGLASAGIAGWYFARNWIALGSPYVGGWDPSRGGAWIQDPGFRIPKDLLSFGAALHYPIYAVFTGVWDALYSSFWLDGFISSSAWAVAAPPWHFDHMVACALLALPLSAAGIAGALRALRAPRNPMEECLLFAALGVAMYVAAIVALYIRLPVFSTVKSSYTLGLAPCYGVLFAYGLDLLPRRPTVRALLAGYLVAWLAFVFRAYFS